MRTKLLAGIAGLALLGATAAIAYGPPNYMTPGGATWEVGGLLEVLPGGTFRLDTGTKTATAVAGVATLNKLSGSVTSEPLTTAASATYTLTINDARVAPGDVVLTSVDNGTNTGGGPHMGVVHAGAGTITAVVRNSAVSALNGTVVVTFAVLKN